MVLWAVLVAGPSSAPAQVAHGAAPRLDAVQADLGVARARADAELARSSRRSAQAELNALLNRPPGQAISVAGNMEDVPALPTMDQATATAMAANIEVLTADQESAIESRTTDLLKAERIEQPAFTFGTALNAPGEFRVGPHAGIILVDYANIVSARGGDPIESLIEAGAVRLRPILMTTLCTLFGLLPLALGLGPGAEMQKPLAIAVIGGLSVTTVITLVFVPTLLALLRRRHVQ